MAETQPIEVERLRGEVAALQRRLASERAVRNARIRTVTSWVLTVLAVLATTLALLSIWTFRTLTNTDLFVDRVGSIIEQPEVASAVGEAAAAQLVDALDIQDRLQAALPEEVAVAAAPITTAAQNYLAQGATALVQTDQFQAAWDSALAAGHTISIGVLSGTDTTAVQNSDGVIVLNLTPVVNALLAEGSEFLSGLLDRDISAPAVTEENIDAAVAALEQQLGTDLPAEFGQVTLFASDDLAAAQSWYQTIRVAVWLAPIAAIVLIGLAIAVSTRRLRTSLSIVIGTALLLLLVAVALEPIESSVVGSVAEDGLRDAVGSAFSTVLGSLLTGIVVVVLLGVIAAGALFLTGSSSMAASGRHVLGQAPSLAARYRGWFLGGGAVVALLLLAVIPGRSWTQLLVVLLLYAAFALAVLLAPRPVEAEASPDELTAVP
jgi:hypothetical protein